MPLLAKALLLMLKSRRGRELLFAVSLGAIELARSERAKKVYATTSAAVRDPRWREAAAEAAGKAKKRIRR